MPLRCVDLYGFFTALRSFTLPAAFRAKKVAKGAAPYSVTMHLLTLQRELLQLLEKTSEDLSRLKNPPVDRAYRLPVYFQAPVTTRAHLFSQLSEAGVAGHLHSLTSSGI